MRHKAGQRADPFDTLQTGDVAGTFLYGQDPLQTFDRTKKDGH